MLCTSSISINFDSRFYLMNVLIKYEFSSVVIKSYMKLCISTPVITTMC